MTPSDIEALAHTLQRQGISECEVHDDNEAFTVALKLGFAEVTLPQKPATTAAQSPGLVHSPGMGRFSAHHPLVDGPVATAGQRVQAGQAVGYLLAGSLITEITSPHAAVLGRQLVQDGELLGYGDVVFQLS
jgi:biotin carboxyl carrier protein